MKEIHFRKSGKLLTLIIVAVLSLVVAFSVAFTYDGRNDLNSVSQRETYSNKQSGRTTDYGTVDGTSEEYIAAQGYANNASWTAISDANGLKNYIKNQGGKNGYITAPITFDWNDADKPYTAPVGAAILAEGLVLDGCGYLVTNNSTSYYQPNDDGYKNSRGVDEYQEEIKGEEDVYRNWYHNSMGTFFNVIKGTVKNLNYDLNSHHIFATSEQKYQSAGGLAGFVTTNGVVDNVSVKYSANGGIGVHQMNENMEPERGNWMNNFVFAGGIAGTSMGEIKNTEMTVENGGQIFAKAHGRRNGTIGLYRYTMPYAYSGGIVGRLNDGSINNTVFNGYSDGTTKKALFAEAHEANATHRYSNTSMICGDFQGDNARINNVLANAPNGLPNTVDNSIADCSKYWGYIVANIRSGNKDTQITNYYRMSPDKDRVFGRAELGQGTIIDLRGEGLTAQFNDNSQLVVSNADANKIVWGRSDNGDEIYKANSNSYTVPSIANNADVTFTYGTTAVVSELKFDSASVEFDNNTYKARFCDGNGVITALDNSPTIKYSKDGIDTSECKGVGEYTATYAAIGDKQIGANTDKKILYLGETDLTANMTITPRVITVNASIDNVYNSTLTFDRLVGDILPYVEYEGHNVVITDGRCSLENAATYTVKSNNVNYIFADNKTELEFTVAPKTITVDPRITINGDISGAEITDGQLTINVKTDSIALAAESDSYGRKVAAILGAEVNNVAATNSRYTADVTINNDVAALTLDLVNQTVTAAANSNNNELGTASVSNAEPTIGESVTFTAAAAEGNVFLGWTMDGKYVSFAPEYTTVVGLEGKALVAVFSATGANVTIVNGSKGGVVANFYIDLALLADYEIGEVIVNTELLGSAAKGAVDGQPYNTFYGWKIVDINTDESGVITGYSITAIYDAGSKTVSVSIDGNIKEMKVNSDITLERGDYTVNGVSITVSEVTTLKALDGLTIAKDGGPSKENNATGAYDTLNGILQINAAVEDGMEIRVVISDSDEKNVIAATINGSVTMLGNVKIVQAIITVPTGYITATAGKTVKAQIFKVNGESSVLIGEIVLTTAEVA